MTQIGTARILRVIAIPSPSVLTNRSATEPETPTFGARESVRPGHSYFRRTTEGTGGPRRTSLVESSHYPTDAKDHIGMDPRAGHPTVPLTASVVAHASAVGWTSIAWSQLCALAGVLTPVS